MTFPTPLTPDIPLQPETLERLASSETPIHRRLDRVVRIARCLFETKIAALALTDGETTWFEVGHGIEPADRIASVCALARRDGPLLVEDARQHPELRRDPVVADDGGIAFFASVPIHGADGSHAGVVCIAHDTPRSMGAEQVEMLQDLAEIAQSELSAARASALQVDLFEQVTAERRRAMIDDLTGVWNRAGIMEVAERTADARSPRGWALVSVDLDRFKSINDTLGHAAGDRVLREVAQRLDGALRDADSVGRLGGDEFLLILASCESRDAAVSAVERVRRDVHAGAIETGSGALEVSASFGVRFVNPNERVCLERVIEDADRALYASKHAGRDRVVAA